MANRIEIIIDSVTHGLENGLRKSSSGLAKFGRVAIGVAGVVGIGLAVAIDKSVKAALGMQAVNARLATSFKDAGLHIARYKTAIDKAETSGRNLGFSDEQTATSLGSLVTATKNVTTSLKDLKVIQDTARFTGKSLADSTKMVTMAMTGSQRAAKALGITVQPVTAHFDALAKGATKAQKAHAKFLDKIATGNAVIDALKQHVKGQAEAYSKTLPGAIATAQAWLQHLEVELGNKLLPIFTKAVNWIRANWPQISAVIKQAWADIQPVLAALGSLVVGVVAIIRNHWGTIGPFVRLAADQIKTAAKIIADVIKVVADLLQGRWGAAWTAAKDLVSNVAHAIGNEFRNMWLILKTIFDLIVGAVKRVFGWLGKKLPIPDIGGFGGAIKTVLGWIGDIVSAAKIAYNALQNLLGVGGPHQSRGKARGAGGVQGVLPRHKALGGSVSAGMAYMVGERGPEMFTPGAGGTITPNSALGAGGNTYNFHFPHYVGDKRELMNVLRSEAKLFEHQNGRPAFS